MQQLADSLEHGSYADLLATLDSLDAKQRKAAATWLTAQLKLPPAKHPAEPEEPYARRMRTLVAMAALAPDPKKFLAVPVPHEYPNVAWDTNTLVFPVKAEARAALAQALIARGCDFCADLLTQVAEAKRPRPMFIEVLMLVAQAHDLPLPATPVLAEMGAHEWFLRLPWSHTGRPNDHAQWSVAYTVERVDGRVTVQGRGVPWTDAASAIRLLPGAAQLLLATLEHRDVAWYLVWCQGGDYVDALLSAVGELVDSGFVEREALVTGAVAALCRGDSISAQRLQARLLQVARPGAELVLRQAPLLVDVLGTANATAAAVAQALLREADGTQRLPDPLFLDACQRVFARKEKGLRETQTAWAKARGAAAILQDLDGASDMSAPIPAAASAPLRPGMPKRPFEPVPDPARLPAEVEQALGAYRLDRDGLQYERALQAALDAFAAGDRATANAIARRLHAEAAFDGDAVPLAELARRRIDELKAALKLGMPMLNLARPTWAHGAIAAPELVQRLAVLPTTGRLTWTYDLLFALLRCEPPDAATLAELRAIDSGTARAAADFLAAGGTAQLRTRWLTVSGGKDPYFMRRGPHAQWSAGEGTEVCVALDAASVRPQVGEEPTRWAEGFEPDQAPFVSEFDMVDDWAGWVLPNNAEAVAAFHLYGVRRAGMDRHTDGGKAVARRLHYLLSAHGPAGPALHLAVLFTLSANDTDVRLAGSDGLVTLLQQDRFDPALAAELLAACLRCGSVKPGRLAASLAQVVAAGEAQAVWGLVRAGVAATLGMAPPPAATADLVELAARLAPAHAAGTAIPEVRAFAAGVKGAPNKLQAQVLRLAEHLPT
ncbi:hypothetical protein [Hydrogenophaga sp. MI9]|uniref:hypothetical protein n=1 Tax=Hydrogenophaga sp. MI9 TaxID=3453719 RepID=UPI003EEC39A4